MLSVSAFSGSGRRNAETLANVMQKCSVFQRSQAQAYGTLKHSQMSSTSAQCFSVLKLRPAER
eukprot:9096524-Alexandrium_andersonii.AAC.1